MDSPRPQSIRSSRYPNFHFDETEAGELNKIDRFAALAKVIEPAISTFLSMPETQEFVDTVQERRVLDGFMMNTIYGVLKDSISNDTFSYIHDRLNEHQQARFDAHKSWAPEYHNVLLAGASTFVNNTSNVFSLLERAYGPKTAAHPNNWRIIDKLARMNVRHQAAYSQIYLSESINWTHTISHFTPDTVRGGIQFVAGYPTLASVPKISVDPRQRMLGREDLMVRNATDFINISSIKIDEATIGCPVTFQNQSLIKLWSLYATARERMSPYTSTNAGGSEASHR